MSRNRSGPSPPKTVVLILVPSERCVLVRRGKRIYKFQVRADGSHLHVVGEPPKKMAKRLEEHLAVMAKTLKVPKALLRRCVAQWASGVGVFQEMKFEIPQGRK